MFSIQYVHNLSYQGVEHSIEVFFDEDILCGKADSDEFHIVAGKLPVIVSTDAKLKKDKYEHIGMKHVNTRTLGEKSFMYDLVREA